MSEHTPDSGKLHPLPDTLKIRQSIAQLYDLKEILTMQSLVMDRLKKEVKQSLTKVNNLLDVLEKNNNDLR